jgi:hypothetical protein
LISGKFQGDPAIFHPRLQMFERIRQRLIQERREIEIHRGLLREVLIPLVPYYVAGLPTYVLLVVDAGLDDRFGPWWVLKISHSENWITRVLYSHYFLMKDVISGPIFITTLIAVIGMELMRHHWRIDERMGESSSFL